MRSYVLGDEQALLMASFPKDRPDYPFPYFPEAMTGFEYTAAIGMLYEGQEKDGLECIRHIRARYDGRRRSPFDEAECGHHYARAMVAWAAVLALTGFQYSAVEKRMTFAPRSGTFFWSNGYAWGNCTLESRGDAFLASLSVRGGEVVLGEFHLREFGSHTFENSQTVRSGNQIEVHVQKA